MSRRDTLDLDAVNAFLRERCPELGPIRSAEKFGGGQSNPTYRLAGDRGEYVLRRQPPGELLKSAHAVDREHRVMQALAATGVPVPRTYALCEDREVIGSLFFVMEHVPGRVLWDAALPESDAQERAGIYDEMNRVLAALHEVDVAAVGLGDFGRPGNYFARQIDRWTRQYRASETERIEAMERLIAWLPGHVPADDGQVSLIHGDYRLDNMIFAAAEPRVRALLDWELSTLGHPYADLAYQCMQWRFPRGLPIPGLGGMDRRALGIPTEAEYVQRYCERRGIAAIEHWGFYLAFSFFRMAGILQGVLKRHLEGNASSERAREVGGMARPLAEMGWAVVEQEGGR